MRLPIVSLLLLAACSGDDATDGRAEPEICGDEVDNDGDGLIDCDDTADCGGLQCRTGDDDDDTGTTTEPLPTVEVLFDPTSCCDFEFGPGDCPKLIGSFQAINRSPDLGALLDASCDPVGPSEQPIEFQVQGAAQRVPFLVNAPIDAESTVTVDVWFNCDVTQSFTTECRTKAELDLEEDEVAFTIEATQLAP